MTTPEHPAHAHPAGARRPLALVLAAWLLAVTACGAAENPARGAGDSKEAVARFEELQDTIIAVSDKVKPTVVHIEAIVRRDGRRAKVTGSGIIIDAQGHILTNHHIVDEAENVTVTVPGEKKKLDAKILGTDIQTDVAVIKVESDKPLPSPKFADSDKVRVGEWVIAIGNPYGLDGTVSFGIVSAKGRNLEVEDLINEFIQTDAMIDHGSSGGPLLNLRGEVIGVNSRGQGRGIGFTIPINTALKVRDQIVTAGSIERGYLGIAIQPFDRDMAEYFGVPQENGVIVNSVREGSPAAAAGLKPGDIMTSFDGTPVEAEEDKELSNFQRLVANTAVGKSVKVSLLRDRQPMTITAVIAKQPKVQADEEEAEDIGINVKEITESIYIGHRLDTMDGVIVSYVESGTPAAESNLQMGDVIQEMDGKPVRNLGDFKGVVEATKEKKRFLVKAMRGKDLKFFLVKMDRGTTTPEAPAPPETTEAEKGVTSIAPPPTPGTGAPPGAGVKPPAAPGGKDGVPAAPSPGSAPVAPPAPPAPGGAAE